MRNKKCILEEVIKMNTVKFIGAWGCLIGAGVCLILLREQAGLPMLLSAISIAFSLAPASA